MDEWDDFTIPYTSGTTGKPKGCARTAPLADTDPVRHGRGVRLLRTGRPFSGHRTHVSRCRHDLLAGPVFFGGYAEIMDKFEPEQVMERLGSRSITGFFGVPTHFHALLAARPGTLAASRMQLKTVISNAAALPQAMKERLVAHFGPGLLHETYGSTEAGIVSNLRPPDQLRKQQCVGQPFPCTAVEMRRQDGSDLCGQTKWANCFPAAPICLMVTGGVRRTPPRPIVMAG